MENDYLKRILIIPVKILAGIIAFMIMIKFIFVFYGFIQNPYMVPTNLPYEAVRDVMTSLILLELFALTIQFIIKEIIDPEIIVLTVMTVIGRDIIVLDMQELDYKNIFAISFLFAITILGLYILKSDRQR